jgi:acetyl esterase/lipase
VLPVEVRVAERQGVVDLYFPDRASGPCPAVVFVHGGPVAADLRPTPRDWPLYRGYGSAVAESGAVGVTVDHRLHDVAGYPLAAADVSAAVQGVREDERVDAGRVAIWFFSGGGLLLADWLRTPPGWLRCVAATYPVLAPLPGWEVDPRFRPAQAVVSAGDLPIVLTRAGRERPQVAATVEAFTRTAGHCEAQLEIIDVPGGRHGFDMLDHTDESRQAVRRALDAVLAIVQRGLSDFRDPAPPYGPAPGGPGQPALVSSFCTRRLHFDRRLHRLVGRPAPWHPLYRPTLYLYRRVHSTSRDGFWKGCKG